MHKAACVHCECTKLASFLFTRGEFPEPGLVSLSFPVANTILGYLNSIRRVPQPVRADFCDRDSRERLSGKSAARFAFLCLR